MATSLHTGVVLDALNMAVAQRQPRNVIHHSDHGCQYTSFRFGRRCKEAGVRPSMGTVGDAYDNAMCGELLRHARVRAARPPPVPLAGRGSHGRVRLPRRLLQPAPPSLGARLSIADELRTDPRGRRVNQPRTRPPNRGNFIRPGHAPVAASAMTLTQSRPE